MLKQILSPEQSRDARRLAGVSQQTAANAAGVSRTHLALWEVGKYLLPDATLKALRDYYTKTGYVFDEDQDGGKKNSLLDGSDATKRPQKTNATPGLEGFSLIDGFLVPDGLESGPVENLLAEIAQNDMKIAELAATPAERELLGGYCEKVSDQITQLMARNYTLVQQLRGHETITPCSKADAETKAQTNGDVLSRVFGKIFGHADDEPKKKPFGLTKPGPAAKRKAPGSLLEAAEGGSMPAPPATAPKRATTLLG